MTVKLIQVGLGGFGRSWAVQMVPQVADVELVARVDMDADARRRAESDETLAPAPVFADLETAIAEVAADAVLVVVPMAAHAEATRQALELGKHVICEKPFTETVAEARALADLADTGERVLMVSQNYRHFPPCRTAMQVVERRPVGEILSASIDFRRDAHVQGHNYAWLAEPLLSDMAVHHFDLTRMLFGEVASVSCRTWDEPGSIFTGNPAGSAILTLENGMVVSYRGNWISRRIKTGYAGDWHIECAEGEIFWNNAPASQVEGEVAVREGDGEFEAIPIAPLTYTDRAGTLNAFAQAIETGSEPDLFASARNNLGTLAIIEAAVQSAKQNGELVRTSEFL